jgi:hypothetical protein
VIWLNQLKPKPKSLLHCRVKKSFS